MSYLTNGIMFTHIPFSGGKWMTDQLRKYVGRGKRFGSMHDLPVTEWGYDMEFVMIRQMPEWYRSAHGYMSPNWRCGGTDSAMWNIVMARMVHCRDDDFERWMENIYTTYPGLYSWVLYMYCVPNTTVVHLDDAADWLEANFNFVPSKEPSNEHKDPDLEISSRIRKMVKLMEDPFWYLLTRSEE